MLYLIYCLDKADPGSIRIDERPALSVIKTFGTSEPIS